MADSDENAIITVQDSQPFFTEDEEDIIMPRKRHLTSNVEEPQSQSLLAPKRSRTENAESYIKRRLITVSESLETPKPKEEFASPCQNPEQENEKYECVLCSLCKISNQKDFRNEYYGKLITSELQFVEPCMRTYVYVEILKLIHKNKYGHMPDTEK